MIKIIVTEDQARVIPGTKDSIETVDPAGNRLGFFARPFTDRDLAIARQRSASNEPRRTTQQVIERLNSLEQE